MVRGNDFDKDWFDPRRGFRVREALDRATAIGVVSPDKQALIQGLFPHTDVTWTPNGINPDRWSCLPGDRDIAKNLRKKLSADQRRIVGIFWRVKIQETNPVLA